MTIDKSRPIAIPRIEPRTPGAEAVRYGRLLDATDGGVSAHLVEVTPELAQVWLQRNVGNRKPSRSTIARYARDMERGAWTLSSQAITFSASGRLLNGQNRLQACLRADKPFPVLVLLEMPDQSFSNEDTARRRSRKDRLDIQEEKRTGTLSAAMAWLHTSEVGGLNQPSLASPTPDEERALLEAHPELRASVELVSRGVFSAIGWQGMLAALHYLARKRDPILADAFFDGLGTGEMLRDGEPLYHLRKRLLQNRSATRRLTRVEVCALVIKAWNMTRAGRTKQQMLVWRSSSEPFPEIA